MPRKLSSSKVRRRILQVMGSSSCVRSLQRNWRPLLLLVTVLALFLITPTLRDGYKETIKKGKADTVLVIMLLTHAKDVDARMAVRDTYLKLDPARSKWMFLIGKTTLNYTTELAEEQKLHGDMYFLDCPDDYQSLSLKVFQGFTRAYENYNFKFLLKVDTDSYVSVAQLIDYLLSFEDLNSLYIGIESSYHVVEEHTRHKLPTTRESKYMFGGGYVLSYDLVEYFANTQHMLQWWFDEDVTIGAHLQFLAVKRINDLAHFLTYRGPMNCWAELYVNHKVSIREMYYLYYSHVDLGNQCAFQDEILRKKLDLYPKMMQLPKGNDSTTL